MDQDWRNTFGILICAEMCDGAGAGIYKVTVHQTLAELCAFETSYKLFISGLSSYSLHLVKLKL